MACSFLIVRTIHQHEICNSQGPTGKVCYFLLCHYYRAGSEINFFKAGANWRLKLFFQLPHGKMWLPKQVIKIFPSQRNTNRWKILLTNFPFRNRSEENGFGVTMAIFPITNKISTEKSRQLNHAGHISSFMHRSTKCFKSTLYRLLCPTESKGSYEPTHSWSWP